MWMLVIPMFAFTIAIVLVSTALSLKVEVTIPMFLGLYVVGLIAVYGLYRIRKKQLLNLFHKKM